MTAQGWRRDKASGRSVYFDVLGATISIMSRMCDKLMYSNVTPRGAVSSTAESLLLLRNGAAHVKVVDCPDGTLLAAAIRPLGAIALVV